MVREALGSQGLPLGSFMHLNTGNCQSCLLIINKYPNFHSGLLGWFTSLQKANPEAHVSCGGRGRVDQESDFSAGRSRAHYGQSAHNYNCALDLFRLTLQGASWDKPWFNSVIVNAVDLQNSNPSKTFDILWYGLPGSPYYELPHIEIMSWRSLGLPLVE